MSAVISDQPTNNVAEFLSPGPGERLRAARLSMGYDLAKIAAELHLTTPVVEALEADQFDEIGARVFVRGYLRNYARIVGMPVDSILRQFDEKWPDDGVHHTMLRQSPTLPADGGPSRGLAGAMSWLLVIGVIALFAMWWRGYLDGIVPGDIGADATAQTPAVAEPASEDLSAFNLPGGADPVMADGSLRLPAPPSDLPADTADSAIEPVDADNLPATAAAPESGAGNALPLPAKPAPLPATAASAGGGSLALPKPVTTVAVTTPAPAVAAADVATAALGADGGAPVVDASRQIVLTFDGACWVDVRDSERRFKLFGEMPKGTRKVLGGKPPYKMVIGNAKVVTITVNGEPFDLNRYAKGNVARFTLDP